MTENKSIIKMNHIEAKTFMYGTTLVFGESVYFENLLMPSGTVIHNWQMTSAYFRERHIPTLPVLKRNQQYQIFFDVDEKPANTLYFKLSMYRRNKSLISSIIFKDKIGVFTYETEAYDYEIEMLSASVKSFMFKEIRIEEITGDDHSYNYDHEMNIVIIEPSTLYRERPYAAVEHLEDIILLTIDELNKIHDFNKGINFIGYGPVSNKTAETYASRYDGTAWVSHESTIGKVYGLPIHEPQYKYLNPAFVLKQLQPCDLKR